MYMYLFVIGWSQVIRIGEIDCSQVENRDFCSEYRIGAFPTIRVQNYNY